MRFSIQTGVLALGFISLSLAHAEEGYFRDDFTGSSLKPELSFLAEDKDRWTLIDNDYLMIIPRKYDGGTTNHINYQGNMPESYNFSVSIKSMLHRMDIFLFTSHLAEMKILILVYITM